jgi:putative aldouronate transport system permease protein
MELASKAQSPDRLRRAALKRKLKANAASYLFLAPAFLFFAFFIYYPSISSFLLSLFNYRINGSTFIGLKNYVNLFSDTEFFQSVRTTLQLGIWNVILSFIIPLMLSLMLYELKNIFLQKSYQIVYYFPQLFSWAVVGGMFMMMLAPEGGIVNNIIKSFGGTPINFMMSQKWIQPILIVSSVWKNMGGAVIIYVAALFSIDTQLIEAAQIDGVNTWKKYYYIILPLLKPIIIILFILNFTGQILMIDQGYNMVNAIVDEKGKTIMLFMLRNGYYNLRLGYASSVSVVVFIVTFVVSVLNIKLTGWGKFSD